MPFRTVAPSFFRKADDEAEFARLYERHVEGVFRYAVAMLGDAADAEDVTQTTFLNAYRAFKGGTRPEKPSAWLIAIAHNVCRQRFRQAQRRPREVAFDDGIGEPEVPEHDGPSADELRRALSELPPNQRAALVMRELEGASYNEIASVLGVSVSALEALLFRARRALREQLEERLSCQEAALAISKQLDGRLGIGERRALRAHLRACAECNSLAQSQRAQRRALKSLVLVPLPLTIAHWSGVKSASAATGAGGLTAAGATTGGAGVSSLVLGGAGVAAKVAAVVAAGVVVGGTYEGVSHATRGHSKAANVALARAEARQHRVTASATKTRTPVSHAKARTSGAAQHASKLQPANANASARRHAAKAKPKKNHSHRRSPRGQAVAAAHSQAGKHPHSDGASHAPSPQSLTHSQAGQKSQSAPHAQATTHTNGSTSSQAGAHAKSAGHTQSQTHTRAATQSQSATHTQAGGHATGSTHTSDPTQSTQSRGNAHDGSTSTNQSNASATHGKQPPAATTTTTSTTTTTTTTTTTSAPETDTGGNGTHGK
jgi:RNA polymerase sigma factor (sigma-70 family)